MPASHPVATPRIDLKINFETQGLVDSKENRPDKFTSESKIKANTPYDAPEPNEGDESSDFTVAGGDMNSPINNNYDVSTFHADFYNGWRQADLEYLIDYCIKQRKGQGEHAALPEPGSELRAASRTRTSPTPPSQTARRWLRRSIRRSTSSPASPIFSNVPEHVQVRVKPAGTRRSTASSTDARLHKSALAEELHQLTPGEHTFSVQSSYASKTDDSPASRNWTVAAPPGGEVPTRRTRRTPTGLTPPRPGCPDQPHLGRRAPTRAAPG